MAEIRWSHEAEQWLKEIYEYIKQDITENFPCGCGRIAVTVKTVIFFLNESVYSSEKSHLEKAVREVGINS